MVFPTAIVAVVGVITNDKATGPPTVRLALLEVTPSNFAVIAVTPDATPVALPVASIVATVGVPEFQVTCAVMSEDDVLPSAFLNVPVAVYTCVAPTATDAFAGATTMVVSWFTFKVAGVAVMPNAVAVIVVVPEATAVATPVESMVATAGVEEPQVTLMFGVVLPLL